MSLNGARGISRVSQNPGCEFQAAMVVDGVREPEFYRRVTGREYPREYGERIPARRRGIKFEANLHQNNAALLREALAPRFGYDPDEMWVRNLAEEVPGSRDMIRAQRVSRTRNILRDLAAGRPVPHIVIQPQFQLPMGRARSRFISPDYMVLVPQVVMYLPGEEKSFIVRNNVADKADLNLARRQAAVEILALRAEAERVGLANRVANRAGFVFATPFGLKPAEPFEEGLEAEIAEVQRAIAVIDAVAARMAELRRIADSPLEMLTEELPINFEESCIGSCVLSDVCRQRFAGKAKILGDAVADILGAETAIDRLMDLINGATPTTPQEAALAPLVQSAARRVGYNDGTSRRRVA